MSTCVNVAALLDIILLQHPEQFDTVFLVMEFVESDLRKVFKSPYFLTERHV